MPAEAPAWKRIHSAIDFIFLKRYSGRGGVHMNPFQKQNIDGNFYFPGDR